MTTYPKDDPSGAAQFRERMAQKLWAQADDLARTAEVPPGIVYAVTVEVATRWALVAGIAPGVVADSLRRQAQQIDAASAAEN